MKKHVIKSTLLISIIGLILFLSTSNKVANAEPLPSYLEFNKSTGEIKGVKGKIPSNLIIPSTIEGAPVTKIGVKAFSDHSLSSVVIPNSITEIKEKAFKDCGLEGNLVIPNSVVNIGKEAFSDNKLNGTLTIPESIREIGEEAFSDNKFEDTLIILNGVVSIGKEAFSDNKFKGSLVIPESVREIGKEAFEDNKFDGDLVILSGVVNIGEKAFSDNNFKGKLVVPSSVEEIGEKAFYDNQLTEAILNDKLTYIGKESFAKNDIRNVELGKNLKKIGEEAFNKNKINRIKIPANVLFKKDTFNNSFLKDYETLNKGEGVYNYDWIKKQWVIGGEYEDEDLEDSFFPIPNIVIVNNHETSGTIKDTQIEGIYKGLTFEIVGRDTKYTGIPVDISNDWLKVESLKEGEFLIRSIPSPVTKQVIDIY